MGRRWRWWVVLLVVAGLVALPLLAARLPVSSPAVSPTALLAAVRASGSVGWSGYGESRGRLGLPDVSQLGDVTSLLGTTTRHRVWWRGPQDNRVDALALTGEIDRAEDPYGSWRFNSEKAFALRSDGQVPVHLPEAGDLVAPVLGRRLAGTKDVHLTPLGARRIAGRTTVGLRLVPARPQTTTVASADLWIEPRSGLALRVDLRAGANTAPVLTSLLLDLDEHRPGVLSTQFTAGRDVTVSSGTADLAARVAELAPYVLPRAIAGLVRSDAVSSAEGAAGVASYGAGFGQLLVLPLPRGSDLARSFGDLGDQFTTPLLNALLVEQGRRRFLVAGTVPLTVLLDVRTALLADPPERASAP
jgi:hypothetical protein